jgi:hypothetical protein
LIGQYKDAHLIVIFHSHTLKRDSFESHAPEQ